MPQPGEPTTYERRDVPVLRRIGWPREESFRLELRDVVW